MILTSLMSAACSNLYLWQWNQNEPAVFTVSANWAFGQLPALYRGFNSSLVEKFDAVHSSIQRLLGPVCPNTPMGKESAIHYPRRDRVPLVNFLICLVIPSQVQLNRLNGKCVCAPLCLCEREKVTTCPCVAINEFHQTNIVIDESTIKNELNILSCEEVVLELFSKSC